MALEPLGLVLGGGGLLPSEDAPPAPPQASGAAFPEVALRVGKDGAPAPPPSHQSRLLGHRPLSRVDTALGRVARPVVSSQPLRPACQWHVFRHLWDVGPISEVGSRLEWDKRLCQCTPTAGGWGTQTPAAACVRPRAAVRLRPHGRGVGRLPGLRMWGQGPSDDGQAPSSDRVFVS